MQKWLVDKRVVAAACFVSALFSWLAVYLYFNSNPIAAYQAAVGGLGWFAAGVYKLNAKDLNNEP